MARASAAASWICSARCFCVSFVPRLPLVRRQVRGLSPRGERLFCLALQECRRLAACFFQRAGLGASASTVCCVCLFPPQPPSVGLCCGSRWGAAALAHGGGTHGSVASSSVAGWLLALLLLGAVGICWHGCFLPLYAVLHEGVSVPFPLRLGGWPGGALLPNRSNKSEKLVCKNITIS